MSPFLMLASLWALGPEALQTVRRRRGLRWPQLETRRIFYLRRRVSESRNADIRAADCMGTCRDDPARRLRNPGG
jgi:hypothetical protein